MEEYDVIIVGAGAAGMTAGIYCARNGLKTAIVSKDIGGTANSILLLENYPGFYGSGAELMKKFYDLTKKYEIDFIMDEVDLIKKQKEKFLIKTKGPERVLASSEENVRQKKNLISKSVIIATGSERKKLKIPVKKSLLEKV
jgi:thioredoxin reductase (NADPH)